MNVFSLLGIKKRNAQERREEKMPLDGPMRSEPSGARLARGHSTAAVVAGSGVPLPDGFSEDVLRANLALDFSSSPDPTPNAARDVLDRSAPSQNAGAGAIASMPVAPMHTAMIGLTGNALDANALVQVATSLESADSTSPDRVEPGRTLDDFDEYIDALEARLAMQGDARMKSVPAPTEAEAPLLPPTPDGPCAFSESDLSLDIPNEIESSELGAFLNVLTQTMLALPGAIDLFCRMPDRAELHEKAAQLLEDLAQASQRTGIRGMVTFASHCGNLVEALAGAGFGKTHAAFGTLRRGTAVLKQMSNVVWGSGVLEVDAAEVLDEIIEAEYRALVDVTAREQVHTIALRASTERVEPGTRGRPADDEASLLDRLLGPEVLAPGLSRA